MTQYPDFADCVGLSDRRRFHSAGGMKSRMLVRRLAVNAVLAGGGFRSRHRQLRMRLSPQSSES